MNIDNYNKALKQLGLLGPKGEIFDKTSESFTLVYSMPDGTDKHLPPGDRMNENQRQYTIEILKQSIDRIEKKRLN